MLTNNELSTTIYVKFTKEGIHRYPAAKDIDGVEFLANDHRHIFHFRVDIEVFHDDRDIEFVLFKRELVGLFDRQVLQANNKSCEMLAKDVINYLNSFDKYKGRAITVTVSEDDENGAVVSNRRRT